MTKNFSHTCRLASAAALLCALAAGSVQAQTAATAPTTDPRWAPWLGCWRLVEESVTDREAALLALIGLDAAPRTRTNTTAQVCVAPAPDSTGVVMKTIVSDNPVMSETVIADGSRHTIGDAECSGWQQAEWAPNAPRLYAKAEVACKDQPQRTASGLAILMTGSTWIDVQLIESSEGRNLRVRRYVRGGPQDHAGAIPAELRAAARQPLPKTALTIADVREASGKVKPEVLQAAIVETRTSFALSGRELVALSQAGVSRNVIDLMIAQTFPEKFVVERVSYGGGGGGGGFGWSSSSIDDYWNPLFYASYYAPFGYNYWGRFNPYYFSGPGFVVIDPGGNGEIQPSGTGRVIDGRGYTRVTTRQPDPPSISGGRGIGGTSSTSSGSGSGSSGATSGGYSSGGSGGSSSGGRTAQPRPPGQ